MEFIPEDFQINWQAELISAPVHTKGVYRFNKIRRTAPGSHEEKRIIVLVVDEDDRPIHGVKVAFSFSTAKHYTIDKTYTWKPPSPRKADIFPTDGSGTIEHIQGEGVKKGQPGGVTVYILDPRYVSDVITGLGMLHDHTGVHVTFKLKRVGVRSTNERLTKIENRLDILEGRKQ